ncbi:heterokaryon incompatibility protein-domain-containing protein, partial [Nemania sp. FL0031]
MPTPGEASSSTKSAVTYSRGTVEYKLLNKPLEEPTLRARRANAHRPSPGEWLRITTGKRWSIQLERDNEQQFQYSKLGEGEIRILRLYQSKHPDDPLRADLFKRKLEDITGGYEALSYCWGTQKATYNIHIRDLNATTPGRRKTTPPTTATDMWKTAINAISHTDFKIRKNLYDGLLRLRSKYRDVYLWVDAICIDQSERGKVEKAKQLAMMARIYNSASNVCVWLGEGYDGAETAFALVRDIMNYRNFDEMILDPKAKGAWRDLIFIMKAPWFSRRWVIQEIALSRDASIHCGDRILHWDDFADAVSLLMEKIELIRDTFKDDAFDDVETTSACILVQTLCNVCRKADQGEDQGRLVSGLLDVETLVSTLLGFQATFPRDTIYSILSLAKDFPEIQEEWQELHTLQLVAVRDKKVRSIDVELEATTKKREMFEEARLKQKPLLKFVRDQQELIEKKKKEKQEARISVNRELESRIDEELRQMKIAEIEYADEALQTLDNGILQLKTKFTQLEGLRERTSQELETQPIGLLPNYKFSPRDLFIAFVTRSIYQSRSLDIICRHWAPELVDDQGGDTLPSWISSLSNSPFGILGTAQGRQNGENFVAYLPHDQRRRYSASGVSQAEIEMALDPALDFQDGQNLLEINVPEFHVPKTKLSIASHQLGLSKTSPQSLLSAEPVSYHESLPETDEERGVANADANELPSPTNTRVNSHSSIYQPLNREDGAKGQTSRSGSRRPSISQRTLSGTMQLKGRTSKGSGSHYSPTSTNKDPKQSKHSVLKRRKTLSAPEARQQDRLSGILCVKGFILGEIVDQSEVMRGGIIPGEWVAKLGWEKDVNSENRVPDTLWRLLVADRMEKGGKPPQWYKRACLHGLVDDKVSDNQGNIHPVAHSNRKISELTSKYFKRVESVVWNRRVFELKLDRKLLGDLAPELSRSKKGKGGFSNGMPNGTSSKKNIDVNIPGEAELGEDDESSDGEVFETEDMQWDVLDGDEQEPIYGLAPQGCKVSDIVCILLGCSVPVVLSRDRESLYKVVGEAYVHGMMDGEALEMYLKEEERNGEAQFTTFQLI